MSNALAIATVTQTLRNVLAAALGTFSVNGAQVTTLRPDDPSLQGTSVTPGVNVFLYQVTPNTAWRNSDLPTRKADGSPVQRPRAALDLHYLLSFYGVDTTLDQQRLLGAVALALHAAPALDRATIQQTEEAQPLYASGLDQQQDLVRFTPIHFSLEEMSKLWSVFLKTDYVLSLAYIASPVLIEPDVPPAGALPVRLANLEVFPFTLAVIDSVNPQAVQLPSAITLQGAGLNADNIVTFMTPGEPAPIAGVINPGATSQSMTVTLPAGLRPGVNSVQLTQSAPAGSPPGSSQQIISQSNAAPFVILPALVSVGPASPAGTLTAVVSPAVGPLQQVYLVLNQIAGSPPGGSAPQAFALPATPQEVETDTFSFNTTFAGGAVPPGTYLARVRVDSAESLLAVDASGAYNGPLVTVP